MKLNEYEKMMSEACDKLVAAQDENSRLCTALEELADVARRAIAHVGLANYAEREIEANRWVREKLEELLSR